MAACMQNVNVSSISSYHEQIERHSTSSKWTRSGFKSYGMSDYICDGLDVTLIHDLSLPGECRRAESGVSTQSPLRRMTQHGDSLSASTHHGGPISRKVSVGQTSEVVSRRLCCFCSSQHWIGWRSRHVGSARRIDDTHLDLPFLVYAEAKSIDKGDTATVSPMLELRSKSL